MPRRDQPVTPSSPSSIRRWVDGIADEFEDAWNRGETPAIRAFVPDAPGLARGVLLMELVKIDMEYRWVSDDRWTAQDYCRAFPELSWPGTRVPNELEAREAQLRSRYGDASDTAVTAGTLVTVGPAGLAAAPPAGSEAPFAGKLGAYRIVREVGHGGMGTVYEAVRDWDGLRVALKVLRRALMAEPVCVGRFLREAQSAANLHHPNIVEVHEIGEAAKHYYFSMEFIDGESLRRRLCREERLPVKEAVDLVLQAARGLAHAWQQGIVHRDVKPGNLMIREDGVLKVTDLGLARYAEVTGELTESGESLGTPSYMAPEQVFDAKHADFRADIYSLGATFYQALTGRTPFVGSATLEIIRQLQHDQPRPVRELAPDVPEPVARIAETMLAKDPIERYQSAGELLSGLETAGASLGLP